MCTVPTTIHLQSYAERAGVLKITNMSDGAVLLQPMSGETINTHSTLTIKHKVSTVDLVPINGGYII